MVFFRRSGMWILAVLMVSALAVLGSDGAVTAQSQSPPALSDSDCIKCHAGPPADVAAAGGKHKNVGCIDCHAGHRPMSKQNIPRCDQCHVGAPHFELPGCLTCHRNPHTPLKITLAGKITDPCLSCHTQQIVQLREHKSKHSALACSMCHSVHREKPQCLGCHKPHSSDMVVSDCTKCHRAHMPKDVTYAAEISSKLCASCHQKAYALLTASETKHKSLNCAFCHQEKHRMVPQCQACHGAPHPAGILAKFPRCSECHNIAHDLNNWPSGTAAKKKESPREVKKKRE